MKKIIYLIAAASCWFGSIAAAQSSKQKVAVYVTGEADAGYRKVIGSKLVSGITRSDEYVAVERTSDFLSALTREQDYQMSGAVSDTQIVKLGQQFGVRYVLVADVSEVFESMFVSARMIDVQTGQITVSAEASQTVDSMEGLTKLSEKIIQLLFHTTHFSEDAIKILGPYSDVRSLYEAPYPSGYHLASQEEIAQIIRNDQIFDKKTSFPIYSEIEKSSTTNHTYFRVESTEGKRSYYDDSLIRPYTNYYITCICIYSESSKTTKNLSYCYDAIDSAKSIAQNLYGYNCRISGLNPMGTNPSITPGYLYFIKDKGRE